MGFRSYRSPNAHDPLKRFVLSVPKELSYQGDPPDWIRELYLQPLKAGWRRLVVIRRKSALFRRGDVYYTSPDGYKFRSRQEIGQYCMDKNIQEFSAAFNFCFKSVPLGGECARYEKIIHATGPDPEPTKKGSDSKDKISDNSSIGDSVGQINGVKSLGPEITSEQAMEHNSKKTRSTEPPSKKKPREDRVYCICDGDISGLMVRCDYSECPLQWYHLKCLKIDSAPSGKWYCPICRGEDSTKLNVAYTFQDSFIS